MGESLCIQWLHRTYGNLAKIYSTFLYHGWMKFVQRKFSALQYLWFQLLTVKSRLWILEMSISSFSLSTDLMAFRISSLLLGNTPKFPSSVNPTISLDVLPGGETTEKRTDVVTIKREGMVLNCRVRSCTGLSTLSRVNSATPRTKGTLVIPPSWAL